MLTLKGTEWTTFSVGMGQYTQFTPSTWHGKLVSLLSLAVGQDIYDVRKSIADLRKLTNIGKIMGCGIGPRQKGNTKKPKATTVSC